ncbi:MAG: glutamyl-tRNA reductase [Phycisphaerae bacterium]|nr:glutamyl-tRNA reductase [Phycisphaerae bacterium]
MRLICAGLNHVSAPLALREAVAVAPDAEADLLRDLHRRRPEAEFLLLNTCNRTELYALRPRHSRPREEELRDVLLSHRTEPSAALREAIYARAGVEAVRHLFSVAAGLDSLVPGESQIVSQVKRAMATARSAGAAGAAMTRLLAEALRTARRVRRETPIARGKASVASVAMQAVRDMFPPPAEPSVLTIGGGTMIELFLRLLKKRRTGPIFVANRSFTRAKELAAACEGCPTPFEDLEGALAKIDVVVTCTAAPEPILRADMLRHARRERNGSPMLLVDLAVPRDVEPAAADIPGVRLRNLDDLSDIVARTVERRAEYIDAAAEIVSRHVARYVRTADVRTVAPTIDALYRRIEETLNVELAEAANKLSTHDDQNEDMEILRRTLHRALRRFCHPAVETLRAEAADGAGGAHAETLRILFQLSDTMENGREG